MRRLITTIAILTFVLGISAQLSNPVHFSAQLRTENGVDAEIIFTAKIDAGWHVYSTELGNNGPISATFNAVKMDGVETIGKLQARGKEIKQFDKLFEMELRYFEQAATFVQKVRFTKPDYDIDCYLEYGACNDQACLPPSEAAFKQKGKSPTVKEKTEKAEDVTDQVTPVPSLSGEDTDTAAIMPPLQTVSSDSLWSPVVEELRAMGGNDAIADHSLLYILLMGFIGGLLAVCMPCIWPIIPMTVSFFLKRAKSDKKKGIRDAFTYGISIIVIYLGLGLLVTALFGSDTLNAMSTNAVFNIFLFLLLVVFALSFFGWFEIKLPESWANSVDTKATETSGLISIFLMAFTLVLVSFSCTAPIIGLLLVETTTSGNWLAPALGMLGFAVALALPFTLFAMFPSWLKQAPKSGSWMNTLKIVLGFIELAFALKFFSVADLAYGWHLLDREVFLSLWIVIFALLGAYLCGWLKFQTDEIGGNLHKPMPVACIMGGLVSLAFAVYMIPGLWGAPCKAVSAFAPPMNTQDFNLNTKTVEAKYTDYDEGMAAAKALGKPVLIDFTGYGCVNCRKMEAAVWTDPTVADMLTDDFVLISLYVDDKTPLAEPLEVTTSQDETKILRTVGAKWSWLQSQKFGANAQPFYVMLDNNGKPLSASRAYDEDVNGYINFLKQGLLKYQQ
ncbi:Thiol:disulfide interchange protein DsbD [Xylanibacter ruminicola]|uniref:Thiol:disulfide interchange protein DsbD n=1 Tax=Xylanibacter ruminicola TaxID=839 RepID=A0A1H5UN54_XYLRU|nr:cytochrome c biogenesis protein CcdA [Xylanibacter ruminicola]SEF76492.1 Thiol:disulfide interchange protein DsbD [Xylanibacter ruminicola]